ncbi:MAG: CRISPR-associated helicase Cas3', partial [Candidatus Bathyarchaeia archaeon]
MTNLKELIRDFIIQWCVHKNKHNSDHKKCVQDINEEYLERESEIAEKIYYELSSSDKGKLIILKAPTGAGKTEILSSVFLYQWLVGEWFAGRLFWIEPTHALLRQMKDRLNIYVGSLKNKTSSIPPSVSEDHGDVINKTFLYTSVITLTTIDSLVYGYVAKRIQSWVEEGVETGRYTLPAGLITNSLAVFDEAHLIQDEAFFGPRIIQKVLCSMIKAGGLVIFASATLPSKLIEFIEEECGEVSKYELNSYMRRDVNIDIVEGKSLQDELETGIRCDGGTLIILNTVERAQRVFEKMRSRCGRDRVLLLHSLMTRKDKEDVLNTLKYKVDSSILVSTQVAEVGIDL